MSKLRLGVNVDHVATIRQARGARYPDPVYLAKCAEAAGADGITIHLREDRRHIQDKDVFAMKDSIIVPLNLECAVTPEMVDIAVKVKPHYVCLVPERREELTTEGGLDVVSQQDSVGKAIETLQDAGIKVSLFIDPDPAQVKQAKALKAELVELHTGSYAEAFLSSEEHRELDRIHHAAALAHEMGLIVNAGHGLHYHNVEPIAAIPQLYELNIGHAIVAKSLECGMAQAVRDMQFLMDRSRNAHQVT